MSRRKLSIAFNAIRIGSDEPTHPKSTTGTAGFEEGKIKGSAPALHKSLSRLMLAGASRSCGCRLIFTILSVPQR